MTIKKLLLKIKPIEHYAKGRKLHINPYFIKGNAILNDSHYQKVQELNHYEHTKSPSRSEVINYLLSLSDSDTNYLEIGVRNPVDNFDLIQASKKYSIDPGVEFKSNPVDFKMTSDAFFEKFSANEVLSNDLKFDVIFIDGLHLAEQVDRDIENAIKYIKDDGFIVLHDCNPPTEWHARENFQYFQTPAHEMWNGTTWKAFLKWRSNPLVNSCCIDSDWGIGILSKRYKIGKSIAQVNPFYEFNVLENNRKAHLNLVDFKTLKESTSKQTSTD